MQHTSRILHTATSLALASFCAGAMAQTPAPERSVPSVASPQAVTTDSYLDRLAALRRHLNLIRRGPSPQPFLLDSPPVGVREVTYPSGSLSLKAWVAYPVAASSNAKVPGVVFFHGGFAFGANDFEDARPFLEAGFAVMCPMLRGEDGNPGDFEMLLGEVDDTSAAITWFTTQPEVDAARIYTFGHGAGGIVSALLSLRPVPIRHGGSSGGLYGTRMFDLAWAKGAVPFAPEDFRERELRVLVGNVNWIQRNQYAYIGTADPDQEASLVRQQIKSGSPLTIVEIAGDHFTSLAPSVTAYIERIKAEP